ncbi:MAG: ArsA family ATPase [Candidatus Aminicenantes bacterium]|nr:ArsA family ATPase [Candidatus Aminicenantes bacterium]
MGKTTSAVACALVLAERNPNKKILLVSTDPAHSVGDSLDRQIGDRVVPVQGVDHLFAWEADAERLLAEFKLKNGPVLAKIADRGTYFDKEDIRSFLELSLPGMDEFMAILELMELVKDRQYDAIIMDTAPTGHTIRLLELPGLLQQWVSILDLMMKKHRFMARTFSRGRYLPDECDRWLETMAGDAKRVEKLLQDAAATEFVVVTIPEEMAVAESERLVAALKRLSIPVRNLIVNHVVEQDSPCPFCQGVRAEQAGSMDRIQREFADLNLLKLPQLPCEVRGVESLRRFARFFAGGAHPAAVEDCARPAPTAVSEVPRCGSTLLLPTARLVLIGGKGGVGKSSVAAATALELASRFPEKKVLIFSTDPAHSLSDSFGRKIGTEITPIEGIPNLYAQEIDAPKLLVDFTRRYREAIDEIFNSFLGGGEVKVEFDQEVMERLLDLSPPGIDEVMALIEVMELMEGREFDIFVLDTAPTGHLIRFLEMPDIARDWLGAAMKTLLKYRGMARLGSVAGLVMKYAKQVRKLRKQLLDAAGTEIVVVTIPEAMGVVEMKRLLQALSRFKIACRQIVINMVTPPNDCSFCSLKREEERRYVREVIAHCPDLRVGCVPRLSRPVCGFRNLLEFREILYSA